MAEPDVTVVVPVYNTMPYLTETLDSLVRQTIHPGRFEVVAVDDGSTDGSGDELDRYAEQHPGLLTVVHQPNSGGPAGPCNVGLEHARGRYVFFLGADDWLGEEALERMVAKADAWHSDVLCVRIVGEGGRWVNQVLYAHDAEDVPFPSGLLASALSNTKLFRRSLLSEHGITFARDLKVGSDQPFTIEAMLHARRISVLGDYAYYHAVRREDASNITYSSDWRSRFAGIAAIVEHVAELVGPGEGRDLLLGRHFSGEIATLLRRDFYQVDDVEQVELVGAVESLSRRFLTDAMLPRLRVLDRWRLLLAQNQKLADIRALASLDEEPTPLSVTGDDVVLHYPNLVPSPAAASDRIGRHLAAAVGAAEVVVHESSLDVTVPLGLVEPSSPTVRIALAHAREGASPPVRSYPRDPSSGLVSVSGETFAGVLRGRLDLTGLARAPRQGRLLALRVQFDIGERTYGLPVPLGLSQPVAGRDGSDHLIDVRHDGAGMTLVDVVPARRSTLDKLRARWGRRK